MNYELAKKLDYAGFPNYEEDWVDEIGHVVIHPTLSELIEACGDRFLTLIKYENTNVKKGLWSAGSTDTNGYHYLKRGGGSTPEEAVANLWLELNNENHN